MQNPSDEIHSGGNTMREIWKTMKQNVQDSFSDLDKTCTRTKRELLLGTVACTAVGIILGIVFSPKKTTTIGSHNGNNFSDSPAQNPETEEERE